MATATITPTVSPTVRVVHLKTPTSKSKKAAKGKKIEATVTPTKKEKRSAARFRKASIAAPTATAHVGTSRAPLRSDIPVLAPAPTDNIGRVKAETMKAIAEKRRLDRKELIANQIAIAGRYGLQYLHVGRTTIAFQERTVGGRRGKVLRFSTSRCHPNDSFSKGLGSAYAAKNFAEGHWIEMKSPFPETIDNRRFLTAIAGVSESLVSADLAADEINYSEFGL